MKRHLPGSSMNIILILVLLLSAGCGNLLFGPIDPLPPEPRWIEFNNVIVLFKPLDGETQLTIQNQNKESAARIVVFQKAKNWNEGEDPWSVIFDETLPTPNGSSLPSLVRWLDVYEGDVLRVEITIEKSGETYEEEFMVGSVDHNDP